MHLKSQRHSGKGTTVTGTGFDVAGSGFQSGPATPGFVFVNVS